MNTNKQNGQGLLLYAIFCGLIAVIVVVILVGIPSVGKLLKSLSEGGDLTKALAGAVVVTGAGAEVQAVSKRARRKWYQAFSQTLSATRNCQRTGNMEWRDRHIDTLNSLVLDYMPHGSGIDAGVQIDWERTAPEHLVFTFSFRYMDDNGFYAGWYDYSLHVTPSLAFGVNIRITGRNTPNDIKEYLYQIFDEVVNTMVD